MKMNKPLSVGMLGQLTGLGLDEILLTLWENGIDYAVDEKSIISGQHLLLIKKILGIPLTSQITSITYWQKVFSLNENDMRLFLAQRDISMSKYARKLPKGAIKKLMREIKARNQTLPLVEIKQEVKAPEIITDLIAWRTVGKKVGHIYQMNYDEILGIHNALVVDFLDHHDPINPPGVKNSVLLQSAVYRQDTSIGNEQKYDSIEMKGAALLHSLIHNHPFHNGNKRTALVSLLVFLDKNQRMFTCTEDELFKFVLTVAQHRIVKGNFTDLPDREVMAIAEWIRDCSRIVEFGEKIVSFRKMKPILNRYDCQINHSGGGTNIKVIRIKKGGLFKKSKTLISNFSIRNEGEELQLRTLKKIRQELELDEEHGIDSAAFYDETPAAVDEFIIKYRKTLARLARL